MSSAILYTTDDGKSRIQLHAQGDTVRISQRQMAELFDVSADNISLHLENLYTEGELSKTATTEESSVVQMNEPKQIKLSDERWQR